MKQLVDLTCCRALFAAWVFAYHLNLQTRYDQVIGPFGAVVRHGYMGVDAFFILSGMILAYVHPDLQTTARDMRGFWAKRLVRIYPVHLAMIALMSAMIGGALVMGVHARDPERFGLDELASHLALLHAWGVSDRWAWNYPSWSISAEWAGYLAFPIFWPIVRRHNAMVALLLVPLTFAGAIGAREYGWSHDLSLTFDGGLLRFFPEFALGAATARLMPRVPAWLPGKTVAVAGIAIVIGASIAESEIAVLPGLWLLLAGLMVAGLRKRPSFMARLPAMVWLGEVSYSYYMSFAVVETTQSAIWRSLHADPSQLKLLYILSTTAMTLALAALSWAVVEKPALRAFAGWERRQKALRLRFAGQ